MKLTTEKGKFKMANKQLDLSKFNNPSPKDDAPIRANIEKDPDTWEVSGDVPAHRRGRSTGSNKSQVTIKLDNDVLAALKAPEAKGWQTRANALLRQALGF